MGPRSREMLVAMHFAMPVADFKMGIYQLFSIKRARLDQFKGLKAACLLSA
jgi:hypothetical protein